MHRCAMCCLLHRTHSSLAHYPPPRSKTSHCTSHFTTSQTRTSQFTPARTTIMSGTLSVAFLNSCFSQLRQLQSVRRSDNWCPSYFGTCVHCQPGRLLQCRPLWSTVSAQVTRRLQMLLNAAAHLVVGANRRDHISPVLREVTSAAQWSTPPVEQTFVWPIEMTCSSRKSTRSSADEASMLLLQLFGTLFVFICARHPSVEDNSELG